MGKEQFVGFGISMQAIGNTAPELRSMAQQFPAEFAKALRMAGAHVRKELAQTVEKGGPASGWPDLSHMQVSRRLERAKRNGRASFAALKKQDAADRKKGSTGNRLMNQLKSEIREATPMGSVGRTLRYKMQGKNTVAIGALSPSSAKFLEAVQGGLRGSKGEFQFNGTQYITPTMRRMLWASGIPVAKSTAYFKQPKRALVLPVYNEINPQIVAYIQDKIAALVERK